MIGTVLGHYRITEKLGAGGMGEVWRARDTRLNRDVAIKALPPAFAQDRERLARFEREAQLLASFNHPNIAAVYGLEEWDGKPHLVLELVEGEALRGPLPVEEAAPLVRQLLDALKEAHDKGIIHRDLKPANIKVTPEGKLKVLDFGLAKALADESPAEVATNSPTLTLAAMTRSGVLLGTAAYMSPEQARGKVVDKRADIWAFGCVVYELLSGKQAFGGETVSDSLVAVLKGEPDWSALPSSTPPQTRRLLALCLEKDPKRRLQDVGDAQIVMEASEPQITTKTQRHEEKPGFSFVSWCLCGGIAVLVLALLTISLVHFREPPPAPRQVVRTIIPMPDSAPLRWVTVSPDGSRLAYLAGQPSQIHLRSMDQLEAKPMSGTEGAQNIFISPDGQWLGFSGPDNKIKKVPVNGGAAITLCDGLGLRGTSWGPDGAIVWGRATGGLVKVSSAGGKPEELTTPDEKKGEAGHLYPQVLPDGRAVLFTIRLSASSADDSRIAVLDRKTGRQQVLVEGGSMGKYIPTGHLVYWRAGSLFAVPFDAQRLQVTGQAVPVLEGVSGYSGTGFADFSFSDTGTLVYVPGASQAANTNLVWVDRQGRAQLLGAPSREYIGPRLSPDGGRVAVAIGSAINQTDIWVYDLSRATLTRVTFRPGSYYPVWTPDGKRISFVLFREKGALLSAPADGSGGVEQLLAPKSGAPFSSWSPDGKLLAYNTGSGKQDIWVLPADGERKPRPFLETPFSKLSPEFSPDGHWLAYSANDSGPYQVYVRPAPRVDGSPPPAGQWQISTDGGDTPRWARNGRELFYRNGDKVMAVAVESGGASSGPFRAGTAKMLFEGRFEMLGPQAASGRAWDVSPDGKRFLMIKPEQQGTGPSRLHVVTDWFEELKRRAPVPK